MNKKQEQQIQMFQSVMEVLKDNSTTFGQVPAFEEHFQQFETLYGHLLEYSLEQSALKRTPVLTQQQREKLALKAEELCAALFSIGRQQEDHSLMGACNISYTDLRKARNAEAARIYNFIHALGEKYQVQLQELGWDEAKFQQFGDEALDYLNETGAIKVKRANQREKSMKIEKTINDLLDLLKEHMDAVALQLRPTHKAVHFLYEEARNQHGSGGQPSSEQGGNTSPPDLNL